MEVLFVPEAGPAERIGWTVFWAAAILGGSYFLLSWRVGHAESRGSATPSELSARYRGLADRWVKGGRPRPAVGAYAAAIRYTSRADASLYWARGDAWMLLKAYREAGRDYDLAAAAAPGAPYPLIGKAMSLAMEGRHQDAVGFAERALALDPGLELAYFWRGFAEERLGKLDEAERDYGLAIERNPSAGNYYMARAVVRLKRKDLGGAKSDLERGVSLNPQLTGTPLFQSIRKAYPRLLPAS